MKYFNHGGGNLDLANMLSDTDSDIEQFYYYYYYICFWILDFLDFQIPGPGLIHSHGDPTLANGPI